MKRTFLAIFVLMSACVSLVAARKDYTGFVDTRIGTDSDFAFSHGNTYPATGMPFAQHLWSPQTGDRYDGWKYSWPHKEIRGFGQTHQCSPWMQDYAVFLLMPETGRLVTGLKDRGASFSHDNETARPHYYKVTLDNGITTEIAPTPRCGFFRFSFPKKDPAYLLLDGYNDLSEIHIDPSKKEITGWVNNVRFISDKESFRCHFIIRFDQPFLEYGTWENEDGGIFPDKTDGEGKGFGAYVRFKPGAKVNARISSSYISPEQAEITLERELGKFRRLEDVAAEGQRVWNDLFGRVDVGGGTEEEVRTFYSCLFRANLFSREFYEIDKEGNPYYYSPYDGKVHEGYMFTDNGFWDTFRSQFPLSDIVHPTMQGRYMNALLDAQEQCGWLPQWSAPGETGGMVGNHAISLLADAWAKGIRSFDPQRALKAYAHEAMNKGPWAGANGRGGWEDYWTLGYVSHRGGNGATAMTLEYAYDDFCAWKLAESVGNGFYSRIFGNSMFNYRNVFDPQTGFMRGRDKEGNWTEPFDPEEWGGAYVEGDAWHYTWSVFQDIQGLINLFGGDKNFTDKLYAVFTTEPSLKTGTYGGVIHEMAEMVAAGMGQYAHGNQPIQHMPYLYCYAGQPWKTQYWVRQIMSRLYNSGPQGYPGDEDQGGMSSWYVLSALGIYSVTPGTDQYVLGSPVFRDAVITLEDGKKFRIVAEGNSPVNVYIQTATLNGKPLDANYIRYHDIVSGGELRLVMGPEPAYGRGTTKAAAPYSVSEPED
ncbi:MAG: GH92 family glycosyl hydrolase [Bacteroidales bacterium]|nr:GH92 family glycosyl hydrolase [Bacteroidales bacterium]